MQVYQQVLTFGGSPVVISIQDAQSRVIGRASRLYAEPDNSNTHACYVGVAAMASGDTSAHVIKQLQSPATGVNPVGNYFQVEDGNGKDTLELAQYAFDGTSGEKIKVTIHVE